MGLAPLCSTKMECENEYEINQSKKKTFPAGQYSPVGKEKVT